MKGQYRIISELILFGLGIMITTYVIINFTNVQDSLKSVTAQDQLTAVADTLSNSIVKIANTENSSMYIDIPDRVSDSDYVIQLSSFNGGTLVIRTIDSKVIVRRQLFNINYDNIVPGNNIVNDSEVYSSATSVRLVKNEKITIVRA